MYERDNVLSKDELFMGIAHLTALRSKDPSTQVGACIVSDTDRIMAVGYNGTPRGVDDSDFNWSRSDSNEDIGILDTKYPYVIHAERNAILNYNGLLKDFSNSILYTTLYPCNECAKEIVTVGIKEVVYDGDPRMEQWIYAASEKILKDSGVKIRKISPLEKIVNVDMPEFDKVLEFYKGFKQEEFISTADVASFDESNIANDRAIMKMDLIAEEFIELCEAFYGVDSASVLKDAYAVAKEKDEHNRDIVECADASGDLRYVLYGFEIETGIPSKEIFTEIHNSNMSKLDENGEPIISDGSTGAPVGKILKGKDFFRPDIKGIIENNKNS